MSSTFTQLGVPADIAERLTARGIAEPFPIQQATLPDALAGRDVSGKAPTGSGKTLAFGIPLVARVGRARARRPRGLVLVPTRELAAQVQRELASLTGVRGRTVASFYGGTGFGPQRAALRSGTDIAVACPGRLADLVQRGEVILDEVDMVVLDEADRMADMGFLPEVRRLLDRVRPDRQTLLFSATLDGDVDVLVRRYQRNPVRHELAAAEDAPENHHVFWLSPRADRVELTAKVIGERSPAVVFCRTRRGADRVAKQLRAAGVTAAAIHGDRSQNQRERALADFTRGSVRALVATDIAARGIHVDDVACVVHFDPPGDEKDYVHRSGRTGRAGASGVVVSLVQEEVVGEAKKLQRKLGLPLGVHVPDLSDVGDDPVVRAPVAEAPVPVGTRPDQKAPTRRRRRPRPATAGGGPRGEGGSRGQGGRGSAAGRGSGQRRSGRSSG